MSKLIHQQYEEALRWCNEKDGEIAALRSQLAEAKRLLEIAMLRLDAVENVVRHDEAAIRRVVDNCRAFLARSAGK